MHLFVKSFIILFCLLFFSTQPTSTYAATERNITTAQWQQLTSDKTFSYKNEKEKVWTPKNDKPGPIAQFFMSLFAFLASGGGLALAWLLALSIVGYIVYKLFAGNGSILFSKGKKNLNETGPQGEEAEDITTTNWESLLHQALSNNDGRLAVRYSYMRVLQLLQQHGLIQYRNDKTNYDYYTELDETHYKQPFKQLSRQYEYAWYGHYNLSPEVYNEYIAQFNDLKKQLGAW